MPSKKWVAWCNIFLSLFMAILLSICLTVGQQIHLSFAGFAYTFAFAFVTSLIVAFFAHLPRIGAWYARMGGGQPNALGSFMFDSAIQVSYFLVIVNLVMVIALTGIGFLGAFSFFDRWWMMNIQFWPVAYVAYLVALPLSMGLASKIAGKPGEATVPKAAKPQAAAGEALKPEVAQAQQHEAAQH